MEMNAECESPDEAVRAKGLKAEPHATVVGLLLYGARARRQAAQRLVEIGALGLGALFDLRLLRRSQRTAAQGRHGDHNR
mgnify:CR=1 FL=1